MHRLICEDSSSLRFDDATQRHGKTTGTASWDRPAIALAARHERVGERTGAGPLGWLHRSLGEPYHPGLDVPVLEGGVDDVPG